MLYLKELQTRSPCHSVGHPTNPALEPRVATNWVITVNWDDSILADWQSLTYLLHFCRALFIKREKAPPANFVGGIIYSGNSMWKVVNLNCGELAWPVGPAVHKVVNYTAFYQKLWFILILIFALKHYSTNLRLACNIHALLIYLELEQTSYFCIFQTQLHFPFWLKIGELCLIRFNQTELWGGLVFFRVCVNIDM